MAVVVLGEKIKTQFSAETPVAESLRYIINPEKTEGGRLISSNYDAAQTDWRRLARAMEVDLEATPQGIRSNTVWAYHVKQSFAPDDPVTPEQVHEMGVMLAEHITGGRYKYVVATHTNRAHLHNHIIICGASDITHEHMRLKRDCIKQWREFSDELCRERGLSVIDRPGERRAPSWGELMAGAKGTSTKDRLRVLIDMTAAQSKDFDSFRDMLETAGVRVEARGKHLTFTNLETGFRVRDAKLGEAYDMASIMARLSRDTVTPISFNEHLIAGKDARTVTVWLPGSKRQSKITIPRGRCITTGSTWRAFLPESREQTILDRRGQYVKTVQTADLYEWFGRPSTSIGRYSEEKLAVQAGVSEAQRRYYMVQGRKLDDLRELARAVNAASRWQREAGGDADLGLQRLRERVREERAGLQAAVVALADAIDSGDETRQVEAQEEMGLREKRVSHLEGDLTAIEHAIKSEGKTRSEGEQQREKNRVITRGRRF